MAKNLGFRKHGGKTGNCIAITNQEMVEFTDSRNPICAMKLRTKKLYTLLISGLCLSMMMGCQEVTQEEKQEQITKPVEETINEPTLIEEEEEVQIKNKERSFIMVKPDGV